MKHNRQFTLSTPGQGMINIDRQVERAIGDSGVQSGICVVFSPHTTAGITINENADPDVKADMLHALAQISPDLAAFRHLEGNSHAHVKASLMGSSVTVIVEEGRPLLGTWQSIYFCEFDGPRTRTCLVKVVGD